MNPSVLSKTCFEKKIKIPKNLSCSLLITKIIIAVNAKSKLINVIKLGVIFVLNIKYETIEAVSQINLYLKT